jgi:hypothetical protein
MSSVEPSQKLRDLLSKLASSVQPAARAPQGVAAGSDAATFMLAYSFMLWERDPSGAADAVSKLYAEIIDPNELRVALPEEIAAWCGDSDAHSFERSARLRACLNDIYRREHAVSLQRLASLSKREAREYLDSLEGIPAFVAARVCLMSFGGHAVPIDRRLQSMLEREGALQPGLDLGEAERWLERQVRASESESTVLLLEAWREQGTRRSRPARAERTRKPTPGGKASPARGASQRSKAPGHSAKSASPKRPKKDS